MTIPPNSTGASDDNVNSVRITGRNHYKVYLEVLVDEEPMDYLLAIVVK